MSLFQALEGFVNLVKPNVNSRQAVRRHVGFFRKLGQPIENRPSVFDPSGSSIDVSPRRIVSRRSLRWPALLELGLRSSNLPFSPYDIPGAMRNQLVEYISMVSGTADRVIELPREVTYPGEVQIYDA